MIKKVSLLHLNFSIIFHNIWLQSKICQPEFVTVVCRVSLLMSQSLVVTVVHLGTDSTASDQSSLFASPVADHA